MKRTLIGGAILGASLMLGASPALACQGGGGEGHRGHGQEHGQEHGQGEHHHGGDQPGGCKPSCQGTGDHHLPPGTPVPGTPVPPHDHQGRPCVKHHKPKPPKPVCHKPKPKPPCVHKPKHHPKPIVHPRPPVITPPHHKVPPVHHKVKPLTHITQARYAGPPAAHQLPRTGANVLVYGFAGGALVALGSALTLAGGFRRRSGRAS